MAGFAKRWFGDRIERLFSSRPARKPGARFALRSVCSAEQLEDRRLLAIGPVGAEFLLNTTTASHQQYPQVATDGLGNYVVSWESDQEGGGTNYGVYAQRFNSAGAKVGPEIHVNTFTTGFQGGTDVAMAPNGTFVVVWTSTGQIGSADEIYAQRFDAAGTKLGSEFKVNTFTTGKQNDPSIAMDNTGNFTVVWSSDGQDGSLYGIYAQRYNAAGTAQGAEFRVNTTTANAQVAADIAVDADGDMIVAWNQLNAFATDSDVYAQRINAAGVKQGPEFRVNTFLTGKQIFPAIACDDAGNFLVTWASDGQDGSNNGQYAQRYNAAGTAQGAEFRVNTTTASQQYFGTIGMTPTGDFVISWSSLNQDGSGYGAYAQRYNAAGVAQGGEFKANTTTAGNQFFSTVAVDNTGNNFLITWSSAGQDGGGYGNYGQRYGIVPDSNAGGPYAVSEGGSLALNASATTDASSTPLTYSWDVNGDNVYGDATGVTPTLTWSQLVALGINDGPSTRNVKVQVTNGLGGTAISPVAVLTVSNTAPTVTAGTAGTIAAGATFNGSGSFTDPGADTWTATVNYGDGTGTLPLALNPDKTFSLSHVFNVGGPRTVLVTVTDDDGGVGSASFVVTVTSQMYTGTAGNDTAVINYLTNGDATVQINGGSPVTLTAPTSITFDGLGGADTVTLNGTALADTTSVGIVTLSIGSLTVGLASVESRVLNTGAGNDSVTVLGGATTNTAIDGGADNDSIVLQAGAGVTSVAGGSGVNSLSYSAFSTAVTVNLATGAATAITSPISGIQSVTGGAGNDTLTGDGLANTLVGGAGNDTMTGGAGNDTYVFDADSALGTDLLNEAGGGVDTLDYSATTTLVVVVNLASSAAQTVNVNHTVNLQSASTFENVTGGSLGDTLAGNTLANTFVGGPGNDTMTGSTGNDIYQFNLDTPCGSDTLSDSGGVDTLDFSPSLVQAATLNLALATAQTVNANLSVNLQSATAFENAIGGGGNDVLIGNTAANALTGGAGNDTLTGGAGNDAYLFDADFALGSDTIDEAGGGTDTLNFSATTTQAISLNLATATSQVVNANLSLNLQSASTMEGAIGGSLGDTLTGNTLANTFTGGAGDDTMTGGAGSDNYVFDADSPLGTDTINEAGGGTDTLNFSATTTQAISLNLATATVQVINPNLSLNLQSANTVESAIGGSLADTLLGNTLANTFTGGPGDDTMTGGAGNDTYAFDADVAQGSDLLDESGGGTDTLSFSTTTTQAVTVNLNTATPQVVHANVTINLQSGTTFENIVGGSLGDTLIGTGSANSLTGGPGNDTITGGAGNDTYIFDADVAQGTDLLDESGGGTDTLSFTGTTTQAITVNLGTAVAQVVHANLSINLQSGTAFENIIGGSLGDTLVGNTLNNSLTGGPGNDTITGGAGNDTYLFDADVAQGTDTLDESGGGTDTLSFTATTTQAVTVNLGTATTQFVHTNLSVNLQSGTTFENVIGGSLGDTLFGNSLNNSLTGGPGNDTLTGGAGNDVYIFDTDAATGSDTLDESGGGADTLDFSLTTTKAIAVNLTLPTAQVVNSNLTLTLGSATTIENVVGGALADTITGNTLDNMLIGGNGNDTLLGGDGRDLLFGGTGLDSVNGGNGEDIVIGGRTTYHNETTGTAQLTNLQAIMTEWSRLDLAYAGRVANLLVGGGLAGGNALNATTVLDEATSAVDQLFGGADLDWFFQKVGSDVLNDLIGGETVTTL